MALSKFAYVRDFELPDQLLPGTFILLRIDGHAFHKCPLSPTLPYTPPSAHPSTPTDSPMFIGSPSPTTPAASNSWIMLPFVS